MKTRWLGLAVVWLAAIGAGRGEWQPAKGPLMTRWAKDVSPTRVLPEYPRPQMVRKDWLNLNGVWEVALGKEGSMERQGPLPILVPFPVESALSGVMERADRLWYHRTFTVPREWDKHRVLLHFGAVDWQTKVWLNDNLVGSHKGGYDAFTFEITKALRKEGKQELSVEVSDPTDKGAQPRGKQVTKPGGIYYTPTTGIWQTVWLEPVPDNYITSLRLTADADRGKVKVGVSTSDVGEEYLIRVIIPEFQKASITSMMRVNGMPRHTQLRGPQRMEYSQELEIPTAKLWSPDDPHLYDIRIELLKRREVVDAVDSYFGLRKISVAKDENGVNRLFLNNKPLFQVGPLDQGFWPDGLYTAPTDEALRYDIEVMKKLGFNMARKHVKVEPDRWYYWCDKLGLLVWQDMPSGDRSVAPGHGEIERSRESTVQFELELQNLLDGLHNHPSIVIWVIFNEGWGQFQTQWYTDWTKAHDPTRLVDCASGWNDMSVGHVHDIHAYPGPEAPAIESKRAGVLGEFGGLGLGIDGHTWAKKTWGYRGTKSKEDLTTKYEELLRKVWQLKTEKGLSAAVYTQITDVETEANGLMTYDRAIIKVDVKRAAAANRGK